MVKLSRRLLCAIKEIGKVKTIADIGTDHGQLIIYALENNIAERAFAVDISQKSLLRARMAAADAGLSDRVKFYVGDGLEPLSVVPDVIVVAGIGGNETVNILNNVSMDTKFVFIPHNDAHVLREYLCEHEYKILKDYIIKDGKFYAVIVAAKGHTKYSRKQIVLGGDNPHTDDFIERIHERKYKIEMILNTENMTAECLQPELREEYEEINKWLKSQI